MEAMEKIAMQKFLMIVLSFKLMIEKLCEWKMLIFIRTGLWSGCVCIFPRKVFSFTLMLIMAIVGDGDANVDARCWFVFFHSVVIALYCFASSCLFSLENKRFFPFFGI